MLMPIGTYVRRGQRLYRKLTSSPAFRKGLQLALHLLSGFVISAASLGNKPVPLAISLLCGGVSGLNGLLTGIGAALGYLLFWGSSGAQGMVWTAAGILLCLTLSGRRLQQEMPLLMPAMAGLSVAISGLMMIFWGSQDVNFPLYALHIALAAGGAWVFAAAAEDRDPVTKWLHWGIWILALSQITIFPRFSLGMVAVGALAATAPFPAAALAGLAVDLAQISPVPITAVACFAFFLRLIPGLPKWTAHTAPAVVYLVMAPLCGVWEYIPAIALLIGGAAGLFLPRSTPFARRRGESGVAQVRLEMASGVLRQCRLLLMQVNEPPIDEEALVSRAVQRACLTCSCRTNCPHLADAMAMPVSLLHKPLLGPEDLAVHCRKRGRLLQEMRRSQEQLRAIKADRDRRREYRSALTQQYGFLSEYLQDLSDTLPRRASTARPRFDVDIGVASAGKEPANGDKYLWFSGPACQYFVLLCDGMGTGLGAEEESRTATDILKKLLTAGYPAEHALLTLNSLCALQGKAGAVTVDLTCIDLQTGKAELYKWGAAPSYLLHDGSIEKIGTAGPPPGLSVTNTRQTVDKLSLRRGQTLLMVSDGVDTDAMHHQAGDLARGASGEVATRVLELGRGEISDDATAIAVRLTPLTSST